MAARVVMRSLVVLVSCLLFNSCHCNVEFITPCRQNDRPCMVKSAQRAVLPVAAGQPQFGMKPMDPLHVGRVAANQGGLDMHFDNTIVKGLRKAKVLDMTRHGDRITLKVKGSVVMAGDYRLDGKLLLMPIQGHGQYKIKIQDIVVEFSLDMRREKSGGEEYWHINSWNFKDHVETRVRFLFHNLFNGNKDLSDATHTFANENWEAIYKELSAPIVRQVVTDVVHEVSKLFSHVPVRQLALD